MNRNDEPNTDKDHNVRRAALIDIGVVYLLLISALLWNWLA